MLSVIPLPLRGEVLALAPLLGSLLHSHLAQPTLFQEVKAAWSPSLHSRTLPLLRVLAAPLSLLLVLFPYSQTFCPHILILGFVLEKTLIKAVSYTVEISLLRTPVITGP